MNSFTPEAQWFARRRDVAAAQRTEDAFQTWLATDPENRVRYEQCELAWERASELAGDRDIQAWLSRLDARVAGHTRHTFAARDSKRFVWAAAATVVLGIGIWSWNALQVPEYQTAIGEQRDILLPDRSRITLNTATQVRVKYDEHMRRIELAQGEALFDVRSDPSRPFEVIAGAGVARALGTRFTVERAGDAMTVSVLDGLVRIERKDEPAQPSLPVLEEGQAASLAVNGAVSPIKAANVRRIQAWQDRKLDFDAEPLSNAVAEFNRYSAKPLVLGRPELEDLRISGVFHIGALEGFVFALQESFGLRVIENGEERLVLPAPTAAAPPPGT